MNAEGDSLSIGNHTFETLSIWWRLRVQLKDPQDMDIVLPAITVEASPPTIVEKEAHAGRYNFVLLQRDHENEDIGIQGEPALLVRSHCVCSLDWTRLHGCTNQGHFCSKLRQRLYTMHAPCLCATFQVFIRQEPHTRCWNKHV